MDPVTIGVTLLGSLLGGSRRNRGSSSSTSTTTGTSTTSGLSTTTSNESGSTAYGSTTSFDVKNMTPEGFEAMFKAMNMGERIANDAFKFYSREQALADAELAMGQLFREYRENELPKVFIAQAGSGLYNSTTGQLMANDAYARAVDLANARKLEFLTKYQQMLNDSVGLFMRSIDLNKGSVKQGSESTSGASSTSSTRTSVTTSSQTTDSTSRTIGNSSNRGTQFGLGPNIIGGLFGPIGGPGA